ncbi:MAG: phage tail protein [Bacteroidota bacterium]
MSNRNPNPRLPNMESKIPEEVKDRIVQGATEAYNFGKQNRFIGGVPPLGHRFGVFFLAGGFIPNPLDFRFSKLSGLGQTMESETIKEGGRNTSQWKLPKQVNAENLVLERGFIWGSALALEFNVAMTLFKFYTSNVIVTLFNEEGMPVSAWLLLKAYPAKWSVSDFDASQSNLVIDHMELAYSRMLTLRV